MNMLLASVSSEYFIGGGCFLFFALVFGVFYFLPEMPTEDGKELDVGVLFRWMGLGRKSRQPQTTPDKEFRSERMDLKRGKAHGIFSIGVFLSVFLAVFLALFIFLWINKRSTFGHVNVDTEYSREGVEFKGEFKAR